MSGETRAEYGIEDLAERAGVSRRTVRYYVQRGLLPTPTGVGRGKHYTEEHLTRLVRIRELQEAGVSLADIGARLDGPLEAAPEPAPVTPTQTTWTRVVLEEDMELMLRGRRLDESQVESIRAALRQILGR